MTGPESFHFVAYEVSRHLQAVEENRLFESESAFIAHADTQAIQGGVLPRTGSRQIIRCSGMILGQG
jgi:hypothetical protein